MLGVIINVAAVLLGGTIGTLCGSFIKEKYTSSIMTVMGLVTLVMGIQSAIGTENILVVMGCLVIGTILGVLLKIDDSINGMGEKIRCRLEGTRLGKGKFAEAFITTSILFCVGTMTVLGSIQSGLNNDHSILIAKSIMDFVSSVVFSAALGVGVLFSAATVLVIQGAIALLAGGAAPLLTSEVIAEMSAVGGAVIIGMGINLIGISQKKIKVGDMLPAILLPILYFPLAQLLS